MRCIALLAALVAACPAWAQEEVADEVADTTSQQAGGEEAGAEQAGAAAKARPVAKKKNRKKAIKRALKRRVKLAPRDIYSRRGPGVVLILAVSEDGTGEMGTGSIISAEGHVLTNAHVIMRESTGKPYEHLRVYLKPKQISGDPQRDLKDPLEAKVVVFNQGLDLAILKLPRRPAGQAVVPLGDSEKIQVGEPVVAIGHPEQGGLWTLTQGVVSTVVANQGGVKGKDVIQTDASINRGNSGGPLLDFSGSMVGVNTNMARKAADGLTITSVNFSVKSNVVKGWIASAGTGVPYQNPAVEAGAEEAGDEEAGAEEASEEAGEAPADSEAGADEAGAASAKPAPAAPAPAPSQPESAKILTPAKPFSAQDLIEREIAEMEDLEKEMQGEVQKRR